MRAYELEESAVEELKDRLPKLKSHSYDTIDRLMQHVSTKHKITGKKLHDMFVRKYGHTPDTWIKKITNRLGEQGVAEGSENNNPIANKIFFARSNKTPKGWSYDHVGFITQDGKQIQMSGHKGNDVYVTNDVTDDPEFPKQNIKIVSLSKPVSVPTTNSVGAENCGTFVANVLQANGIKGIDTQKIYSVFKKPQEQGVAEGEVLPLKRPMNKVQHGKRTFPPTQRDVKEPEGNVTPLKKSKMNEGVEGPEDVQKIKDFIKWSYKTLNMQKPYPKITISKNTKVAQAGHHTGVHKGNNIWVYVGNRNLIDIFRTIFHELTHHRQMQLNMIKDGDSYPGSPIEMLADMAAGKYIKVYGKDHPEMFQ
jgi:hypothetical protein